MEKREREIQTGYGADREAGGRWRRKRERDRQVMEKSKIHASDGAEREAGE
jgi:hypothetical protein